MWTRGPSCLARPDTHDMAVDDSNDDYECSTFSPPSLPHSIDYLGGEKGCRLDGGARKSSVVSSSDSCGSASSFSSTNSRLSSRSLNVDLALETQLYQSSRHLQEEEELRRIIGTLYGRILDFINEIMVFDEGILNKSSRLESQLKAQLFCSKLDRQKIGCLRERLAEVELVLAEERRERTRMALKAAELQEATTKLTEWNSQLEEKCRSLESISQQHGDTVAQSQKNLESQLMEVTQKRIQLLQDYSNLEEQACHLAKRLGEQDDIEVKLRQENAILKAKLYNTSVAQNAVGAGSSPFWNRRASDPSPTLDLASQRHSLSPEFLDDVDLSNNRPSITDIFKASFGTQLP